MQYTIEPANWRDLGALRHLEQVCFPQDAWPLWDLMGVLTLPNIMRFKAVVEGVMAGFIAGELRHVEDVAWIATLGVLPEYRGQGIGKALIETCERSLRKPIIRLSVRASNEPAIRLYAQIGYRQVDLWKGYYEGGEDALIMEKEMTREEYPPQEQLIS
jgi:ribosomal-protein-alanine N-acetyltransferase